MRLPLSEKTLTPTPAPAVGYSGAGFSWRDSGFCDVCWGMAFKTGKSQIRFGGVLALVGNLGLLYHPDPLARLMMLPLVLVGLYHVMAGNKRDKRERLK